MSFRCPQGHESSTADFCDVCGDPITADPSSTPATPPGSTPASATAAAAPSSLTLPDPAAPVPAALVCPSCSTENPADALFCEACGYDFTTGQLPVPPPAASTPPGPEWVAELWIDADWFAHQQAPGGPPTSGAPAVVSLRAITISIGRRSASRQLYPDIDCSGDGAVSHRHAQLILDHDRWYVEDLGSTNGTFVGSPAETLPDKPLDPHQRHELADDERVYVGAWTRIMVRRATTAERGTSPPTSAP